jgi:hypothetical protein
MRARAACDARVIFCAAAAPGRTLVAGFLDPKSANDGESDTRPQPQRQTLSDLMKRQQAERMDAMQARSIRPFVRIVGIVCACVLRLLKASI